MMNKNGKKPALRQNRTICLPFPQESYDVAVGDPFQFRLYIGEMLAEYPGLFPPETENGWRMKDSYVSEKLGVRIP